MDESKNPTDPATSPLKELLEFLLKNPDEWPGASAPVRFMIDYSKYLHGMVAEALALQKQVAAMLTAFRGQLAEIRERLPPKG